MERLHDEDLIQYLVNSCKSLEVLKYVKFLGYEYVDDETKIDINEYMTTRKKSKKKTDTKYMYLQDSRYGELRLKFHLNCKDESTILVKKLLVPVPDDDGYYTIKGKKYFLLYQLVDSSTYTTRQNLTLKSLMPVTIKRNLKEYSDTNGNSYAAPTYVIYIFRKEVDIMLFYFAKIGVKKALEYFSVSHVIKFKDNEEDKENNLYFPISSKMFLEVNKYFFDKYQYVQSMVFMILSICTNRLSFENLEDKIYWIEKIGSMNATNAYNYYEKGMNTLTFFDRLLDETTKKILKVHDENRKNIYSVIRWMIQNFNELRKKDNLDLDNKRLRCNEYIASLLTKAFSDRVNRIIALGNKVTLDKVKEIFKFPGDIIMQQLYKSGLLRYDDKINDMDFFSKFRFTQKGPNSLGNKNDNNIPMKYRGIHPSYVGRVDINVCGNSDPGTSGIITPFCKTEGLFFNANFEPEDFKYDFEKDVINLRKNSTDKMFIDLSSPNISDYFTMQKMFKDNNSMMEIREIENECLDKYYIKLNLFDDEEDI
jgi:hypothetical protein